VKQRAFRADAFELAEGDQEWLRAKWGMIRKYQTEADAAVNRWRRLSDEINNYLDRKCITDVVERARYRSDSLALQDALETGKWLRGEATAHIADVNLYLKLKELGLL